MKRSSPLITLLAGLVLGGTVLGLDEAAGSGDDVAAPSATVPASSATPSPGGVSAVPTATATPSAAPVSAPVSYAGSATVKGTAVPLAVTVAGSRAIAYLCDGTDLETWFRGAVSPAGLTLTGKNGAKVTGTVAADGVITGRVTVAGGTYDYTIKLARKPGGLYRATEPTRQAVIGWIVQEDGRQTGLATGPDGSAPAPPLDTATLTATVAGTPVTASPADPNAEP